MFRDIKPDAKPNGILTSFACKEYEKTPNFLPKYHTLEPKAAFQDSVAA